MEKRERKITSEPENDGEEEELVLTIKIPKAFSGEFKARRDEVTEVTQKAMLEVLTKQDILHYFVAQRNEVLFVHMHH